MSYGVLLFDIDLRTMIGWGEQFYEGVVPGLQTCREIAKVMRAGRNAEEVERDAGLRSIPPARGTQSHISWVRVIGGQPPPELASKIRKWEAAGATILRG